MTHTKRWAWMGGFFRNKLNLNFETKTHDTDTIKHTLAAVVVRLVVCLLAVAFVCFCKCNDTIN